MARSRRAAPRSRGLAARLARGQAGIAFRGYSRPRARRRSPRRARAAAGRSRGALPRRRRLAARGLRHRRVARRRPRHAAPRSAGRTRPLGRAPDDLVRRRGRRRRGGRHARPRRLRARRFEHRAHAASSVSRPPRPARRRRHTPARRADRVRLVAPRVRSAAPGDGDVRRTKFFPAAPQFGRRGAGGGISARGHASRPRARPGAGARHARDARAVARLRRTRRRLGPPLRRQACRVAAGSRRAPAARGRPRTARRHAARAAVRPAPPAAAGSAHAAARGRHVARARSRALPARHRSLGRTGRRHGGRRPARGVRGGGLPGAIARRRRVGRLGRIRREPRPARFAGLVGTPRRGGAVRSRPSGRAAWRGATVSPFSRTRRMRSRGRHPRTRGSPSMPRRRSWRRSAASRCTEPALSCRPRWPIPRAPPWC